MPPAERTNAETGETMQKIYGEKIQNTLTEMNPNPHHLYSYSRSFQKGMYDLYGQCDVWECDWRRLELYNTHTAAPSFRQWSFSTSFCTTQGRREHKHK